ncbi:MAG TPA: BMP family ABC transporter substrate-binding protein [Anaerolineaceae bacterium]|nr:BMP family ABC transporter substrate-binding protein [Anaerolineaceae bacterium]
MTQLGKYELHEQLGKGGFGTVYRATDTSLGREVALKILHPQLMVDETFVERFIKEARTLASLEHPNIVPIYDMGEIDGRLLIAMRHLSSGSLKSRILADGKIPFKETIYILKQVCEGLQVAHEKGLVHRDLKPANILFDNQGYALVADFGLARAVQTSGVTSSMGIAGTPAYRAPELWRGKPPATPATDVYSLGCILVEMLTGKVLFDGDTTDEIITQHLVDGPQIPEEFPTGTPGEIRQVIEKALVKDPKERYVNAKEFLKGLKEIENGKVIIENVTPDEIGVEVNNEARKILRGSQSNEATVEVEQQPMLTDTIGINRETESESIKDHQTPPPTIFPTIPPPVSPTEIEDSGQGLRNRKGQETESNHPTHKKKRVVWIGIAVVIILVLLCAISSKIIEGLIGQTTVPTNPQAAIVTNPTKFKVCQVTDTGGVDDKSFNATAWKGAQDAANLLNVEAKYLESKEVADFEKNINAFMEEKCDIIITVGFLLGDATKAAAEANPNTRFSIVDYGYSPVIPNIVGQTFQTDEAAFLAGYLAAGVTRTGVVGTFGGMNIPTVSIFMDGFTRGVDYYNGKHGTTVVALGWDVTYSNGFFTNDFSDQQKGYEMAVSLMDEGADVILPVAGPVGLGAAAAVKARGNAYIIGVDSDWYLTAPDFSDITITSVMKLMDVTTFNVIKSAVDGTFQGGSSVGNLANGGVALAPFHNLDGIVSAELKAELEIIKADLIAGKIPLNPVYQQD